MCVYLKLWFNCFWFRLFEATQWKCVYDIVEFCCHSIYAINNKHCHCADLFHWLCKNQIYFWFAISTWAVYALSHDWFKWFIENKSNFAIKIEEEKKVPSQHIKIIFKTSNRLQKRWKGKKSRQNGGNFFYTVRIIAMFCMKKKKAWEEFVYCDISGPLYWNESS